MSLVCAQCSRVNPPDAAYCYHDGAALAGRSGGPINPGSALFPTPFVFPSGTACRNFDHLAITCQQNWSAALDLLKQGFLASFFGGLGRVGYRDGEVFTLPGGFLLVNELPRDAGLPPQVLDYENLGGWPVAMTMGRVG